MNTLMFSRNFIRAVGFTFVISLGSLPANAFTVDFQNTDFENDYANWETTGDASIQQSVFQGIDSYWW